MFGIAMITMLTMAIVMYAKLCAVVGCSAKFNQSRLKIAHTNRQTG